MRLLVHSLSANSRRLATLGVFFGSLFCSQIAATQGLPGLTQPGAFEHPLTSSVLEEVHTLALPLPAQQSPASRSLVHQPVCFERNEGQVEQEVQFLARGPGYQAFLTSTEATIVLLEPGQDTSDFHPNLPIETELANCVFRIALVGANPAVAFEGESERQGKVNYFIGNDPALWRTNIPTFARVRSRGVYPGIDLVFYSRDGQLEYDFVVAPGADPGRIALAFEGADRVDLGRNGELVLCAGGRELRWSKPKVFQEVAGVRTEIDSAYALTATGSHADQLLESPTTGAQSVAFNVAAYNPDNGLVIDPALVYGTYLGASDAQSLGSSIGVDGNGNAYISGLTSSPNFPVKNALFPSHPGTSWSYFITKLDLQGQVVYSTYIGPTALNLPRLTVDSPGNVYLVGCTKSAQFPVVNAVQPTFRGGTVTGDAIALKLNPTGSALVYSTYFGGSGEDAAYGVAIDPVGNVYIAGSTTSRNFPVTNAIQSQYRGGDSDAFLAKLDASGTAVVYSTYFGGTDWEYANAIAIDPEGNACIAGVTHSGNLTTKDAFQSTYGGDSDGFWARVSRTGALLSASYFGGSAEDRIHAIASGKSGDLYLAGGSFSFDFPIENAIQSQIFAAGGPSGAGLTEFVARYRRSSNTLVFSTYLGGSVTEIARAVALDSAENIYILGETLSPDFPTTPDAFQTSNNGGDMSWGVGWEDVLSVLSADGSSLLYSTFLGGTHTDFGQSLALDTKGNVYVAGSTDSADFPLNQPVVPYPGTNSAFVAVFSPLVAGPPVLQIMRTGTTVRIVWPATAIGFVLESSDVLFPIPNWLTVSTTPVAVNDQNVVTLEIGSGPKFFRLNKP